MPLPARLFADDEELGKKNDDHVPGQTDLSLEDSLQWARRSVSSPMRRRRVALVCLAAVVLTLLFSFSGSSSAAPPQAPSKPQADHKAEPTSAPTGAAPRPQLKNANELRYYDGPSNYYALSKSLHAASRSQGLRVRNKNVVFAAANLQSLDRLLPMACEMSRWNRNMVHVAVMGRHDMSIKEIIEINNVDSDCDLMWHDARPDYPKYSTDARFSQSVFLTLEHMWNWIHPQTFIVENEGAEEPVFLKSVTKHAHRHGSAVIQLPQNAMQTLQWIARLDSGSLSAWESTQVEVLIRAPTGSSGSLIRLLRSLGKADYFGKEPPHLTIELPSFMDQPTEDFLDTFEWPPRQKRDDETGGAYGTTSAPPPPPRITLQRRLLRERLTPVESSMRYIEGFYPTRTRDTHVLVLSPDVQVSPLFYHYLLYTVLEYKHSTFAVGTRDAESLAGISLVSPTTLLDGYTPLEVPTHTNAKSDYANTPFFQLQAPDTQACLYFGDKWKELHAFFSQRLDSPVEADSSLVSYSQPAFTSYFLELMRARGYFVLHPGTLDAALATAHKDLSRGPEEWWGKTPDPDPEQHEVDEEPLDAAKGSDGRVLTHHAPAPSRPPLEQPLAWTPLHVLLPSDGDLPELASVPMISHAGAELESLGAVERAARRYTATFQSSIGGCAETDQPPRRKGLGVNDLFCGHYYATAGFDSSIERDEWGDIIPPPMPEREQKQMQNEFLQHLQRQNGVKGADSKADTKAAEKSFAELATDYIGVPPPVAKADAKKDADTRSSADMAAQKETKDQTAKASVEKDSVQSEKPSKADKDTVESKKSSNTDKDADWKEIWADSPADTAASDKVDVRSKASGQSGADAGEAKKKKAATDGISGASAESGQKDAGSSRADPDTAAEQNKAEHIM